MSQDLKQFNFKLSESLLTQLSQLAKTKGVTKTELVIQGIQHILGIRPEKSQAVGVDPGIYQQLDNLEQRLQESVDYQSAVDLKTDKRIKALEDIVESLQEQLTILRIAGSVVDVSAEAVPAASEDVVSDIALTLDNEEAAPEALPLADIDENLVDYIDNSTESGQLELVRVESNDKDLVAKSKTVDSTEMLKALRLEDPQGKWDNDRLTRHRRFKNLKDKWHKAGNLRFKYTGESQKAADSRKNVHLWLISQDE